MKNFIDRYTFEERQRVSSNLLHKYPNSVPVICEAVPKSNLNIPDDMKIKYLVPKETSVGRFVMNVRQQVKLRPEEAIFIFTGNILIPLSKTMSDIYERHKNPDGFLYLVFAGENTFG